VSSCSSIARDRVNESPCRRRLFPGLEQGQEFAAESAFWNIAGICATFPFIIGYVAGAALAPRHRLLSIAAGAVTTTVLFTLASLVIGAVEPSRLVVVPLAATLCAATLWLFRHLPDSAPLRRVRISLPLLAVRAAVASVSVILLTSVAHILGPKWSGLVTGYPVNALPDERLRHLRV
jgi:hypothetical protein